MLQRRKILEELGAIVGSDHVLINGDLSNYERDWRGLARGRALAVVQPSTTGQAAGIVRTCAKYGISLVPQGGNTGLTLGSVPDGSGTQIVLNLRRLDRIRALDRANLTVTVEAGCVLQTLQESAAEAGFIFPMSLAAKGSCTIGGNLATNAGGTQVVRYGNTRALCLGLEVVTAQGAVWSELTGLRKDNTGYDLRDLFIGSEGTLGVITAATMRLEPTPRARLTALTSVPTLAAAVGLLELAREALGPTLTGFEIINRCALKLVNQHFPQLHVPFLNTDGGAAPWFVLLENSDHEGEEHAREHFESFLGTALERRLVFDVVIAANVAQSNNLWQMRESITLAQAKEGVHVKHDVSVPISHIPEFVAATDAALLQAVPGVRLVTFGHLGDGNLHYNVQAPLGFGAAKFLHAHEAQIERIVFDSTVAYDGSISAEHGIGSLKVMLLPRYKSPLALALMRQIKQVLDPLGILNPGRVLLRRDTEAGFQPAAVRNLSAN